MLKFLGGRRRGGNLLLKKVLFSHKEKKFPSRSLQKTFRKRMRMNFEQKRKLLLFLKFLEGGGEEGTFF